MKNYLSTLLLFLLVNGFSFAQTNANALTTTMEFETPTFDFGTVQSGDVVENIFTFKNTGNQMLVIKNAKGSCGCTIPEWPKAPIAPGETGSIKVVFNTKGKSGKQSKRVTITANIEKQQTYLTVKGEVEKVAVEEETAKEEIAWDYSNFDKNEKSATLLAKDCFAIFPNPTSDVLKLEMKEHVGKKVSITIFNAAGKLLKLEQLTDFSDEVWEYNVSDYEAGTYYVNVSIDDARPATKCFVVAR